MFSNTSLAKLCILRPVDADSTEDAFFNFEYTWGINMFHKLWNVVWTFIYRFWLIAETIIHAHPDPFLHVETRCARLRLPRSVRPRKMTLVSNSAVITKSQDRF
jgi:hypothetical protein